MEQFITNWLLKAGKDIAMNLQGITLCYFLNLSFMKVHSKPECFDEYFHEKPHILMKKGAFCENLQNPLAFQKPFGFADFGEFSLFTTKLHLFHPQLY